MDELRPNDFVLADKGFKLSDEFALRGANLVVPTFVVKKKQLHPVEIERTRAIANVRIHIERVIGVLKSKFAILNETIPISMLIKDSKYDISTIDQIIIVCSAFVNLCPSIVAVT